MLSGAQDASNAYVRVQAGAGGTEACDWAQMIVRMYTRWAETKGYKIELVDELRNDSAGVRTATLYIIGDYAYGNLQSETGVHRLVRISPFDSNARRQTSFAAVDVTPEIDGDIDIVIKPDDLVRQTFCSGGPGGQHQNKTQSGVRYIHKPTGIAAESRTERSQHKNDDNAMKLLKSRLFKIEEQKRKAEVEKAWQIARDEDASVVVERFVVGDDYRLLVVGGRMVAAARRVKLARHRYECDLRTAAACAALEQIARVYEVRGIWP